MNKELVYNSSLIALKRYESIKVVKIIGLENINKFIEAIQYNNHITFHDLAHIKLNKSNGLELINMNNVLDSQGDVVCLATVGIIGIFDINKLTEECYNR